MSKHVSIFPDVEKAAQPKEWFEIPGATHHRLYDHEAAVGNAVAKLEEFFGRSL